MADQALAAKAWPFEEARKLLARIEARKKSGQKVEGVLFETGYISNLEEAARLVSEEGRRAFASATAKAIRVYFARQSAK